MTYFDDEKTRKKKGAALLLLMHLREHDEQLLQAQHLLLQVKMVLFHFVISCYLPFYHAIMYLFCFLFSKGIPRRRRKPRSMWVRKWLSDKKRERNGHYSTLLTELRTEDGRAFYNYTRLPRGLYDKVL
jgi:hypothetical protein